MAVFGGHPLALLLLPLVVDRRWRRTWPLALIPATLWLYVPLRAPTALVMHYGAPGTLHGILGYMGMYGGRISGAALPGLLRTLAALGPVTGAVYLVTVLSGRPSARILLTLACVLPVFLFYGVPDVEAYAWLLLLPLGIASAAGIQRLLDRRLAAITLPLLCLAASSAVLGVAGSWDRRGGAVHAIASDILRGVPHGRILCTMDAPSYYCAYLLEVEDRRPDLLAIDRGGLIYGFGLTNGPLGVIPVELSGRVFHATGAWESLPPSGILFSVEDRSLPWEAYDVFDGGLQPTEPLARDMMAEFWSLRALQEEDPDAVAAALERAREYAESRGANSAVDRLAGQLLGSGRD